MSDKPQRPEDEEADDDFHWYMIFFFWVWFVD